MKYHILTSNSLHDIQNQVNQYIAEGWIPQGGIQITVTKTYANSDDGTNSSQWLYAQAMTRP